MKILQLSALIICCSLLSNCKKSSTTDLITTAPIVLPEITKIDFLDKYLK
jgi:hypothetical protein